MMQPKLLLNAPKKMQENYTKMKLSYEQPEEDVRTVKA